MEKSLDIGPFWEFRKGVGPLIGAAIHAGHNLRSEAIPLLAINEEQRFREEDPYSEYWTQVCGTQILTLRSRFEVDLNRPGDQAVYSTSQDSWGIKVWKTPPTNDFISQSLKEHKKFYSNLKVELQKIVNVCDRFVVFDFHSYNHRRVGPDTPPADSLFNPEINIGTGTMNRQQWATVVDGFIDATRGADFLGRYLDVRENIKFKGRYLAQFIHNNFPNSGCVLSIEVKKFFMDEWTGQADIQQVAALRDVFQLGAYAVEQLLNNK